MEKCHKFDQNKTTPNLTEHTTLGIILIPQTNLLNKPGATSVIEVLLQSTILSITVSKGSLV